MQFSTYQKTAFLLLVESKTKARSNFLMSSRKLRRLPDSDKSKQLIIIQVFFGG